MLLAAAGKTVIVAMTANRLNWREVEQVVERCVDSGAAALCLGLTFPVGRAAFSGLALDPVEVETLQRDWEGIVSRYSSPTFSLNRSEEAQDYRYFAEPDLVPVAPSAEWIEELRATLPEPPAERRPFAVCGLKVNRRHILRPFISKARKSSASSGCVIGSRHIGNDRVRERGCYG